MIYQTDNIARLVPRYMSENFWNYCTIIQRSQDISLYHTKYVQKGE